MRKATNLDRSTIHLYDIITLKMNSKPHILLLFAVQFIAALAYEPEYLEKLDYLWDTSNFCSFINQILPTNVSENCAAQLQESCQHPAVIGSILDASSKFPYTGLAVGKRLDVGNFDECLAVDHEYSGGKILGKHCYIGLVIVDLTNTSIANSFKLATCIPNGCSAEDYNTMFQVFFTQKFHIRFPGVFTDTYCTTKEDKKAWAAEDYVTTILIAICVGLMIICTIYDLYLKRTNKKSKHPLFLAFSTYTNTKKLFQTSRSIPNSEQILIFHGLKVVSMMWIVAGHGATITEASSIINYDIYKDYLNKFYTLYLSTAVYAVDTFFFISGFLLAYHYLKIKSRSLKTQIMTVPVQILHRYLRLTPAALMIFLVTISLYGRLGTGPAYNFLTDYVQNGCRKNWWAYFLYIQNYYNYKQEELCLTPTWYLSADMQMFLISPLILIPLAVALREPKKLKTCMWCLAGLNVVAVIIPIAIKLHFRNYNNGLETHTRLVVYFVGIMMGTFMRETKNRPFLSSKFDKKTSSIINLLIWTIILLLLLVLILWNKYVELHAGYEFTSVFMVCAKAVWAVDLSWIVYSSFYGYGGFINWLLTRPTMQIIGKLTYSIYLVHALVVFHYFMINRTKIYVSNYTLFHLWCAHFLISIIVAFFWTLAFESPLIIVEKMIFGGGARQRQIKPKKENLSKDVTIVALQRDANDNIQ